MTWYVYALSDPRTGAVRYIGKTKNASNRFKSHLRARNTSQPQICEWISSLGTAPDIHILHQFDDETSAMLAERREASERRAAGAVLLNRSGGGEACCTNRHSLNVRGVGDRIACIRKSLGWSTALLARKSGVNRTTLSMIQHHCSVGGISAEVAVRVAMALGTTAEYLILGPVIRAETKAA